VVPVPVHPDAEAVIVYLTTAGLPEVLVKVCAIVYPEPALKPDVPDPENKAAVQVMVAFVMLLISSTAVVFPEHITAGFPETESVWFGVIVTLLVFVQPLAVIVSVRL
jgi:hypothetical protein